MGAQFKVAAMTANRPVILVDGDAAYIAGLQARFATYEFLSASVSPELLKGRTVQKLEPSRKQPDPDMIRKAVEAYAKNKNIVAIQDVIDKVLKIGDWDRLDTYELEVSRALRSMGWKRVQLRDGPYRKYAWRKPPPIPRMP